MNITITWEQGGKYWISADKYRVSKQLLEGEAIYTAWIRSNGWKSLKVCKTSDEAKAACELHYMENMK